MRLLITLLFCFPLNMAAAASIEEVVVFSDRAQVTRSATATCRKGKATVRFENLPKSIDVRTLQAEASKGAQALGTSSRTVTTVTASDDRVAALQQELESVDDQLSAVRAEQAVGQQRLQTVSGYRDYFKSVVNEGIRNPRPDTRNWGRILGLFQSEGESGLESRLTQNKKIRELNRRRNGIVQRIQRFGAGASTETLVADVTVDCGRVKSPRVRLSYVAPGATWKPEYDLRFRVRGKGKTGPGKASLTVSAVVSQSTGEDWENAKILLSTAKPAMPSTAPVPGAIYVRGRDAGEQKTLVQAREKREKLRGPASGGGGGGPTSADLEDGGQSFTLQLPRKVTVKSDGRPYWTPVDRRKVDAVSKLIAIPTLSPYVHQIAALNNPAPYPLLAGVIHIHRAGTYIGKSQLAYRGPGEPMEVSLGVDEEVRVERIDLVEKNRSASFLSSTKHIEHGYRVAVESRADTPVEVEIREQIPVSKIEDVKVEIIKKSSKGYALDKHRGFLTWSVPLKPGQEVERDLYFTIHLPEDWKVGR